MKRFSYFLVLTLLFLLPLSYSYAENPSSSLHSYIKDYLEEHRIPGASISIIENDKVTYAESFGITGENEREVTADTPFLLGSISKSLTALATLKLVEEDVIDLDDTVVQHLPSFTLQDQKAASQITIKQLLTQTSGITTFDGLSISDLGSDAADAIQTSLQALSDIELTENPGVVHQYSNANYTILAALIEAVSGQSYADFIDEQIFTPLEMRNAAANLEKAYERGYQSGFQSWFGFPVKSSAAYDNGGAPYGYITASANDMVNYLKALIQKDEEKLVQEELLDLSFSPQVQTGETRYYGFGWRITEPGSENEMIWHSGSTPDSRTDIFFYPKKEWGAVILTNKEHILEEAALLHFRNGLISIMNGEEPTVVEGHMPTIQIFLSILLLILIGTLVRLLLKIKASIEIRYRKTTTIVGVLLIVLSILTIPMLQHFSYSPWHSIQLFAPDIAFLTIGLTALLFGNGALMLLFGLRNKTR
ncbi:serine hydrolase domain-containing protein [Ferdinandcohnia sp. Marseille-Q9671]